MGSDIYRIAGSVKRLFIIVVVLVVVHVDRAFHKDFVLLPGNDPDRIRDLEIHRYKTIGRHIDMLLDDLLRPHRDGS